MWTCPNCGREFKRTNQSHYCGKAPETVDEYIQKQESDKQPALISLKEVIENTIPEAKETIAWSMPTWKGKGNIVQFAAHKNHIGLYVGKEAVDTFIDRLEEFETSKGVIRLKLSEEIPLELVEDIVKWCYTKDQMS